MSQRAPGKSASDFLDADGNIDVSAVRSVTSNYGTDSTHISRERCAEIRTVMADRKHAGDTSAALQIGETTVRRHAKGDCYHDETTIDAPTLSFTRGGGWRVDE